MLTRARLRSQRVRHISTIGVGAVAIATLGALSIISAATSNKIIEYSLAEVGAGNNALTVNTSQIIPDANNYQSSNQYLESALQPISSGALIHEAIFTELTDPHGVRFSLGAAPELHNIVTLTSGRWPTNCSATACEVLAISDVSDFKQSLPRPENIGIDIVGSASLTNGQYFAGTLKPPAGTTLLLSPDMTGIPHLPHFANVHGVDAWVSQLNMKSLLSNGVEKYSAEVVGFEDKLAIDQPNMILTWPQDQLSNAGDLIDQSKKKIALLGFVIASLLLAFVFLSSLRFRKNDQDFRGSLSRIGTPKKALLLELFFETIIPALLAAVLSLILSLVARTALGQAGYSASIHTLFANEWTYLLIVSSWVSLTLAISTYKERSYQRATTVFFLISLISFAGFLWASHEHELKFLGLPIAYALIPALLGAAACSLTVRMFRSHLPPTFIVLKEYLPIWRGITAMVSLACILLSASLALDSGINVDVNTQSRNQVPLDIDIKTGSELVKPFDLASLREYSALVAGSKAFPVLRTGASINGTGAVADSVSLVGVPTQALPLVDKSLHTYSAVEASLPHSIDHAINIGSSKTLTVSVAGIPQVAEILGWFITPRGVRLSEPFAAGIQSRSLTLPGLVPAGSSLFALEIQESSNYLSRRLHANGEGDYSVPLIKGVGEISGISLDGNKAAFDPHLWHSSKFQYILDGNSVVLTPNQLAGIPNVITDDATAALAQNGRLLLNLGGNDYIQVHVAKSLKLFPSAGYRFIVMDLAQMQEVIDAKNPGATTPIELWVSTPDSAEYIHILRSPKFAALEAASRVEIATELRSDPNRSGLVISYRITLGFALLLALLVFITSIPLLKREGGRVFSYLESNGAMPDHIRRAIRVPAVLAIISGELIGLGIGIAISARYISTSIPFLSISLFSFAYLAVGISTALAITTRYFREENLVL